MSASTDATKNEATNNTTNKTQTKTKLTVQEERKAMKETGYKMQVAGDTWYPISKKWWDSWKEYTCFDKGDDDVPGGLEHLHENGKPRPGKIDNSELQDEDNPNALKLDIQENLTHYWIHSTKWDLVYKWYGGGPIFPRKVYEKGTSFRKETYICKDPKLIKITYVNNETGAIDDKCKSEVIGFPKNYQFKQIAKDFEDKMEGWDDNEEKDDTCYVHIWAKFRTIKQIFPVDKKVTVTDEDLKDIDPETWIEIPDDYLKIQIDEIENDENQYKAVVDHLAIEFIQWKKEEKKESKEDDTKNNNENNDNSNDNNNDNDSDIDDDMDNNDNNDNDIKLNENYVNEMINGDPFIFDCNDLRNNNAMNSSLWELKTIIYHYEYKISGYAFSTLNQFNSFHNNNKYKNIQFYQCNNHSYQKLIHTYLKDIKKQLNKFYNNNNDKNNKNEKRKNKLNDDTNEYDCFSLNNKKSNHLFAKDSFFRQSWIF